MSIENQVINKQYSLVANLEPMPPNYPVSAKVVEDSVNCRGVRLTTFEVVSPRYILAEINTHRKLSKNTSSSRAIPTKKHIEKALENIVEPVRYGLNQAGMEAKSRNLTGESLEEARAIWREMAAFNAKGCMRLAELGLHKQWASRPIEWFTSTKMVVSTTDVENLFWLRDHHAAQDEFVHLVQAMKVAMNGSTPKFLGKGDWHLPYLTDRDRVMLSPEDCLKVSF